MWFVGVYKKNESATGDPRADGPEDTLTKHYLTHINENYWLQRNLTFTRLITYKTLLVAQFNAKQKVKASHLEFTVQL